MDDGYIPKPFLLNGKILRSFLLRLEQEKYCQKSLHIKTNTVVLEALANTEGKKERKELERKKHNYQFLQVIYLPTQNNQ